MTLAWFVFGFVCGALDARRISRGQWPLYVPVIATLVVVGWLVSGGR